LTALRSSFRVVESELLGYRRTWRGTVISSLVNPVLFLSAMGLGLGTLVDSSNPDFEISYLAFLATGLLAASGMQNGAGDGSWPVMAGIKWRKSFDGMISTPVSPANIVHGRFIWSTIRLAFVLGIFAIISVLFGAVELGPALLAVPPGVLTGLAFVSTITAWTVTRQNEQSISSLFRFAIIPMFLFSGTFFPISQLPSFLQPVAHFTPLFHGVELTRKIALPGIEEVVTATPVWVHVTYLVVMTAIGVVFAVRLLDRRLRP
jgi:lipooligosaccharide transport system permease protein